eukprot:TRINITY_DN449_c0_g1_i1.p1 TRINITY_DN449_c0_g1~~TRINITY_DN449_c0_g1_i1.p1  ORF type:complete len:480 (-),score=115.80 TRINITY_DN449_c0_g1_i1:1920-3359(-)
MKRSAVTARLPPLPSARAVPKRHRRYRNNVAAKFCPADAAGPRIPALLRQFASQCQIDCHRRWLQLLHTSCEKQGCLVRNCRTGVNFAQTHGAKSLIHSITMFLTYYVPTKVRLRSDHEWRQLLAALFTFHNYCARMRYIKGDHVLTTALYSLRNFRICTIPRRITELAAAGYWDRLEQHTCDASQPPSRSPSEPPSPATQPPAHHHRHLHLHLHNNDDACTTDAFTSTNSAAPTSTASSNAVFAAISAAVYEEAHHVEAAHTAHTAHPVAQYTLIAQQQQQQQQPPAERAQHTHSFVRLATGAAHKRRKQLVHEQHTHTARRRHDAHHQRDKLVVRDKSPPAQHHTQHRAHAQPRVCAHSRAAESLPAHASAEWRDVRRDEGDDNDADCFEAVLGGDTPLIVAQLMDDGWLLRSDDCEVDAEYTNAFLHLPAEVAKMGMRGMSLSCLHVALRNGIWRPVARDGMYIANAYPPDEMFYY